MENILDFDLCKTINGTTEDAVAEMLHLLYEGDYDTELEELLLDAMITNDCGVVGDFWTGFDYEATEDKLHVRYSSKDEQCARDAFLFRVDDVTWLIAVSKIR